MEFLLAYAVIFLARVADVTLATFRTLMVVQGRGVQAAIIGFFEIIIYVTALGTVVNNLDDPWKILSYALGFACGNYLGVLMEGKVALGNLSVQIILKTGDNEELKEQLRNTGFGLTGLMGHGLEGEKEILNLVINRKDLKALQGLIYEYDPTAFITVGNINPISGGYLLPTKK